MNLNPLSLIPAIKQFKISSLVPSLDSLVKAADPRLIPTTHWLSTFVDQSIMPAASAMLLFALCCALIQEQRRAASGASDVTRILYRLLFFVGILAAYRFFFLWILDAAQMLGDLFLQDAQISALAEKMYNSFVHWDLGKLQLAKAVLVGIVAYITYIAAFIVFMLFFFARFMILAMLFVLGPMVFAFSVWDVTARFRTWLVLTLQAALWTVVLKFIMAVSFSFSLDEIYGSGQANLIFVIAANVLFVYLLIKTPAITSTLVGGASFGFLASDMVHQTADKTLKALGWVAENMPRYGTRAVERIRTLTSGEPPVKDSSTGADMRRDPYGALKRVKSFFGSGDKS